MNADGDTCNELCCLVLRILVTMLYATLVCEIQFYIEPNIAIVLAHFCS